jgi:hypothetical protein
MNDSLLELFEVGGKNNFEFTYKIKEGEENIISLDLENKKIYVSIGNIDDKKLETSIRDLIVTIKGGS